MPAEEHPIATGREAVFVQDTHAVDPVPSSSAFGTPLHPAQKGVSDKPTKQSILPVLLPPSTLRPVAFRIFTKKHNLTITSSSLQALATFVGRNCGSGWREEGLAEPVLDEIAKAWKRGGGGVIVEDGTNISLKSILHDLENNMSAGRILTGVTLHGGMTACLPKSDCADSGRSGMTGNNNNGGTGTPRHGSSGGTFGSPDDVLEEQTLSNDLRRWIKIVGAFEQPRLSYSSRKEHFEISTLPPSAFPPTSRRTGIFRDRYNLIYQRLLRNEAFQTPLGRSHPQSLQQFSSKVVTAQQPYKLTSIANLLGRNGTSHLLLGLLSISPRGDLSLTDLSGSIRLDLQHARAVPENGAWFGPGMIILVDGVYEEEEDVTGSALSDNSGVGGTIGGKFVGFSVSGPPCERRGYTLGIDDKKGNGDFAIGTGFGWIDFLGVGSERAQGARMRRIERACLRNLQLDGRKDARRSMVIMSEIHLDCPMTLKALRKVLSSYGTMSDDKVPAAFFLIGSFVQQAMLARGGSIEYKEYFDILASTLLDYPRLLRNSIFVFVPGENDPWASAFSSGAAATVPRTAVPDLFTSRVRRAFTATNNDPETGGTEKFGGSAIWTSNPSRVSVFGPVQEFVVFRDDISGRLRRSALAFKHDRKQASLGSSGWGDRADGVLQLDDGDIMRIDIEGQGTEESCMIPDGERGGEPEVLSPTVLTARKLVKTILDQGNLSPFPLSVRPVLWDYASTLNLYPLPTALILADTEISPFSITYEGCHVMNPGRLAPEGDKSLARWIEYDLLKRKGNVREERF